MKSVGSSSSSGKERYSSLACEDEAIPLTDWVYELHKPTGTPTMEVLFFHGLRFGDYSDAYYSTWMSEDGSQVWPKTWLVEEFPGAHILSIAYDSCLKTAAERGRFDLHNIGENLMQSLIGLEKVNVGQRPLCPVILVGHSFGGLVIKELCRQVHQKRSFRASQVSGKMEKFLENLRGVFYYGTPHRGIPFADIAAPFLSGPLLDYVKLLSKDSARLDEDFQQLCKEYPKLQIAGVGEAHETKSGVFHRLVVPEASARYGPNFCLVRGDHISICKPRNKTSDSFQHLAALIEKVISKIKEEALIEASRRAREIAPPENFQWVPETAAGLTVLAEGIIEDKLRIDKISRLGLVGMGGIGKTTLAKEIFNILGPCFEYSCFVPTVKDIICGVEGLKEKVWQFMHREGRKIGDDVGRWHELKGKELLLVLDDVATDRDIDVLSHIARASGVEKSCFIITSRDHQLLRGMGVDMHDVQCLSEENSKELFMSYAFPNRGVPSESLGKLIEKVVSKCEGLPLTLEVLGKYLCKLVDEEDWEESLDALDKADSVGKLDEKLWAKLKLSYDGLGKEEQQMFLDAAFFSIPCAWPLNLQLLDAKAAWNTRYGKERIRWKTLVEMSLVYETEDHNPIMMHDQLRSLGLKIASEAPFTRRVWDNEEAMRLLEFPSKLDAYVEGIVCLRLHQSREPTSTDVYIARNALSRLQNLEYLDLSVKGIGGRDTTETDGTLVDEAFPTKLVVLRWSRANFKQLPFNPSLLKRLTVLQLIKFPYLDCLPGNIGELSKLKVFRIEDVGLRSLPDTFGQLSRLEQLHIMSCSSLCVIPESFGQLKALKLLTIHWCASFCTIHESFGQLKALKHLAITDCPSLSTLPDTFGRLTALEYLRIRGCKLRTLPDNFGQLSGLQHLEILYCHDLEMLPETFGRLVGLQHLRIICTGLRRIPDCIESLPSLRTLDLKGLPYLAEFPRYLANPRGVKSRLLFRVQDGRFTLDEVGLPYRIMDELHFAECLWIKWFRKHKMAMEKARAADYDGALVELDSTSLAEYSNIPFVAQLHRKVKQFLMLEGGVVKRQMGNKEGALEDLTAALEIRSHDEDGLYDYECRKQRGYVLYLMGNFEAAKIDGERALEILEFNVDTDLTRRADSIKRLIRHGIFPRLAEEGCLEYLNFKFAKLAEEGCFDYLNFGGRSFRDLLLHRKILSEDSKLAKLTEEDYLEYLDIGGKLLRTGAFQIWKIG